MASPRLAPYPGGMPEPSERLKTLALPPGDPLVTPGISGCTGEALLMTGELGGVAGMALLGGGG